MAIAAATTNGLDWRVGLRGCAAPACRRASDRACGRTPCDQLIRAAAPGCSDAGETGALRALRRQPCRLFDQQRQKFDGVEPRRRRRQAGRAEDPEQLRRAAEPVMRSGRAEPAKAMITHVPYQCTVATVVAGLNAEIERAAAGNQRQHRDEEDPGQNEVVGAEPRLLAAQQAAQTNLVQRTRRLRPDRIR